MGQQDVESPAPPQREPQPRNPAAHLAFREHIGPVPVSERPAQSQNPNAIVKINPVFHADTAFRRVFEIAVVMVPPDVQHRTPGQRGKEFQIPLAQIPGGENQVEFIQFAGGVVIVIVGGFHIRHGQNFHGSSRVDGPTPIISTVARPVSSKSS